MFRGVIVPLITPFNEDYSLDLEAFEWLLNFLYEKGVDGVFVNSTTGESVHLRYEESLELVSRAVEVLGGKVKVLSGASADSTLEVVERALKFRDLGVDGVVITPPHYFKLDQENLYCYYSEIASKVDLPIVVYNIPMLTGVSVEPETLEDLVKQHSNITSLKATIDSVGYIRRCVRKVKSVRRDFTVLAGLDDHFLNTLLLGGDGGIMGSMNFAAQLHVGLYKSYVGGDIGGAIEYARKVSLLCEIYEAGASFPAAVKEALNLIGAPVKPIVRPPLRRGDVSVRTSIRRVLREVGLLKEE